jgi:hypothetical protein
MTDLKRAIYERLKQTVQYLSDAHEGEGDVTPENTLAYAAFQLDNAASIVKTDAKTFECQLVSDIQAIAAALREGLEK